MSDLPTTVDELITWFDGVCDARKLRKLATRMIAQDQSISQIWNAIHDHDLLSESARCGWIDRNGSFWGCSWASHERLLKYLGLETDTVEKRGWVRLSFKDYQCIRPLSAEQRNTLSARGILIKD